MENIETDVIIIFNTSYWLKLNIRADKLVPSLSQSEHTPPCRERFWVFWLLIKT